METRQKSYFNWREPRSLCSVSSLRNRLNVGEGWSGVEDTPLPFFLATSP
jgi:hypothetical protein